MLNALNYSKAFRLPKSVRKRSSRHNQNAIPNSQRVVSETHTSLQYPTCEELTPSLYAVRDVIRSSTPLSLHIDTQLKVQASISRRIEQGMKLILNKKSHKDEKSSSSHIKAVLHRNRILLRIFKMHLFRYFLI